ncbi:MAG: hypothetical protein JRN34_03945 [Nitrososphaerota archaeon]|nr:hypothetical protein [Nitrososphaerota archaeon]MDG6942059.1 hypothetical protein [Nitrososphaerota archaeon]MDG6942524.1 hypothetical protein [Nitrososphaerota archaeon]MDG6948311.1 hypothetical protein [Nitrososphaerota archaeon]MDG6950237.1 hypothetical protein [Nitrososphaerota archaeon]
MPKKEEQRIGGACYIGLDSLLDLGRLSCALERAPFPLFAFKEGKSTRIAAQADLFMGTPIFYYFDNGAVDEFLAYRITGEGEEVQFVSSASNASYLYAPVIRVMKMPKPLEGKLGFQDKFMSVEVENVPSLVKVGAYKTLFEEPPLPLFAFKHGGGWVLGTFARIDDYEEASIFFYAMVKEEPSSFLRYTYDRITETTYVRRTDEPGFHYIKVVKLTGAHPLVEF